MCFSMEASFGAGAVLLGIGYAAIAQARTAQQHLLCAIPLLFSFQQFAEGLVWLALQRRSFAGWQGPPLYLFLLAAQVVWPVFLPLAALLTEKEMIRRKILSVLAVAGITAALCFLYGLLRYNARASISHHHIQYTLDFPLLSRWYGGVPYLIATIVAPMLSSNPRMRLIGLLLLGSYLVARLLYKDYLISVWCYFAAVISVVALIEIIRRNKADAVPQT